MKQPTIKIEDKIQKVYSIRCPYCTHEDKIITGNGKEGTEHNYQAHLWFKHKKEMKK